MYSMELKAFKNSQQIKTKFIQRLESHYIQDEIIKGQYWEDGKGCAVGCTIHSDSHNCYETELGIPEWVARLEDVLFEGIPNEYAKEFPLKLLKSIPIGYSNWRHVYHQLCVFMLEKTCKNINNKIVVKAICDIITLHKTESKDEAAWSDVRSAAWSAAGSAAESTTWSVVRSAAEFAVRSAAESAAWSAVRSAARSAESTTWSVVRADAYYKISEKLIELLKNEK